MGQPGQMKKQVENPSMNDARRNSSEIKKNAIEAKQKIKESKMSERKNSEVSKSNRTKKTECKEEATISNRTKKSKCEENSRKKMQHESEVLRKMPQHVRTKSKDEMSFSKSKSRESPKGTNDEQTKENSMSRNKEKSRLNSKQQREKKYSNKNSGTEDEECDFDFSAIENKIFEGFTEAESKKTEAKNSRIKSSGMGKLKEDHIKKSKIRDKDQEAILLRAKKEHSSRNSPEKKVRKDGRNRKKSPQPSSSKEKAPRSRKSKTPDNVKKPIKVRSSEKKKTSKTESDSDISDWEEVEGRNEVTEMEELLSGSNPSTAGKGNVQIELDAPNLLWGIRRRKRRTEEEMIEDYLRKSVNRSIKEVYENMHKTHLLCLFAHGRYVNQTLNSETLLGAALSIITDKNAYPPKRLDMNYLEKFVKWFSKKLRFTPGNLEKDYWNRSLETILEKRFESKTALSNREFVYLFVVVCRALGMNVRLVLSLQPISWKPGPDILIKPKQKGEPDNEYKEPSTSKEGVFKEEQIETKTSKKEKIPNRKMLSTDDEEEPSDKGKGKKTSKAETKEKMLSKPRKRKSNTSDDEDDIDFDPCAKKLLKGPKVSHRRKSGEKRPSEEESGEKEKKRTKIGKDDKDVKKASKKVEAFVEWAEIYVEEEEKWVCVDITRGKIHCVAEIQVRMPSSSAYITAYNANLTVKDVTRRYVSHWLSSERKIRLCSKWWEKSLKAFRAPRTRLDKEEEKEMDQNLQHQPLPKTIGEYKNHPLYALQRHLLKFEAIYPPDVGPVGFLKKEPVYPRDSVYTLCSRDTWMKEAKTVRVDEEPYKIVKARPKWDKNTCQVVKDRPLELFGEWQVEDYEPPVAKDGKVPRNEYGNVELFKPSMLPRGCVHIPINGINRLARKLNIDCAAAMVGFDFHSGWTHPVYDGYVICEEFKDILMDAWNEDQAEQARKAEEKRVKRIYDNWKKLIQGMLIKERVREKYGCSSPTEDKVKEMENVAENNKKEEKEEEEENKSEKTEETVRPKRKIKQEDIDAARPPVITHHVKNLKIDWSSSVVEMAKEKKKATAKQRKPTKKKEPLGEKKVKAPLQSNKPEDLSVNLDMESDSETDEEEKKAKIRAILDWGTQVETNPDLSDDSDIEGEKKCTSPKFPESNTHPFYGSIIKPAKKLAKKHKQHKTKNTGKKKSGISNESSDGSDEEISSASTSRSTTPDPDLDDFENAKQRRTSRRSAVQKTTMYKEDQESDGDISLDDSDCGDHLYQPEVK